MKEDKSLLGSIKWLKEYNKQYEKYLYLSIFSMGFIALINIVKTIFIRDIINDISIIDSSKIISLIIILALLMIAGIFASYLSKYCVGYFGNKVTQNLKDSLVLHIKNIQMSEIDDLSAGDLISRVNNDIKEISNFLTLNLADFIFQPIMFICAAIFMVTLSWKLSLVSFGCIIVALIVTTCLKGKITFHTKRSLELVGKGLTIVLDALKGVEVVKSYRLEEVLESKMNKEFNVSVLEGNKVEKYSAFMLPSFIMMKHFPKLIAIIYGGYLAIKGEILLGHLIAFIQLLDYLIQPATVLPEVINGVSRAVGALERIQQLFDKKEERTTGNNEMIPEEEIAIELKDLHFAYKKDYEILKGISLKVPKNQAVALVGQSGCGKTTIMNILCGFYENQQGSIKLFGKELKDLSLECIRDNISYVSQKSSFFKGSIMENIIYGEENVSFEQVINAAKMANAYDFIMDMPNQFETLVQENGENLSGGQRQRIAIARAIIKNASILLLDEPTSALDYESEVLVCEALERFMKNRTTLVIAHRYSTIQQSDWIYVIDQGQVVESGTHEQLLSNKEMYYQLYQKQFAVADAI
ncbi:ABC transporter ATP-binding protein [Cellulosilyticum ruminicola]|uniref:ABC transporter ATP-binding protein n=1 Tax=Cellulosilyticum ruminicola TaxID=425254 RepID=UPI0006D0752B|nr:ABC transporter ATP-binding protein [Cellulosilyticum ruminicola]